MSTSGSSTTLAAGTSPNAQEDPPRRSTLIYRGLEGRRSLDLPAGLPEELERLVFELVDQFMDGLTRVLIETAKLTRDHLTQLPDRAAGERLFQTAQASGHRLIVGLADFDHFKRLNDTFGHLTGDDGLRAGAKVFDSHCSPKGSSFRFGGEELGFCLCDLDEPTATALLETIRQEIEQLVLIPRGRPDQSVSITVSVGFTAAEPGEGFQDAFARADRALYQAKRAGRNRICVGVD